MSESANVVSASDQHLESNHVSPPPLLGSQPKAIPSLAWIIVTAS